MQEALWPGMAEDGSVAYLDFTRRPCVAVEAHTARLGGVVHAMIVTHRPAAIQLKTSGRQ